MAAISGYKFVNHLKGLVDNLEDVVERRGAALSYDGVLEPVTHADNGVYFYDRNERTSTGNPARGFAKLNFKLLNSDRAAKILDLATKAIDNIKKDLKTIKDLIKQKSTLVNQTHSDKLSREITELCLDEKELKGHLEIAQAAANNPTLREGGKLAASRPLWKKVATAALYLFGTAAAVGVGIALKSYQVI